MRLTLLALALALTPTFALYTPHRSPSSHTNHHSRRPATFHKPTTDPLSFAPLVSSLNANPIQDRYVVLFKPDTDVQEHLVGLKSFVAAFGEDGDSEDYGVNHVYDFGVVRGYAGKFGDRTLEFIRRSSEVAYIEKDQTVHAIDHQANPPWGLERISHHKRPPSDDDKDGSDESVPIKHDYAYRHEAGANVTVYVVDTGVQIHHKDFHRRARWGKTIPEGDDDIDGNGHGTHVAGTIAGKTFGVAKKASIVAVKVLRSNGSGSLSDVVKGIEEVILMHKEDVKVAEKEGGKRKVKSVANMSLGGGRSRVLDIAVDAAVDAGVHFAVAAGNSGDDACDYSPAASTKAITVGATTITDSMAWFSNHGDCVDIYAPGHQILSTWIGTNTSTNTISGTSMASPHVAGVVALMLSFPEYEGLSPKEVKDVLVEQSTKDLVTAIPTWAGGEGKNRLLFVQPPKEEEEGGMFA
ncbi:serine protease [Rhizophlyctis rosea]|nr:serine protease [Rhizophlyctis rosea]